MKYSLIAFFAATFAFLLSACGEEKPGQYPPSLYKDREGLLSDEQLSADKEAATANKIYPADDPAAPHAKSDEEKSARLAEESYPSGTDDPEVPHDLTDDEESAKLAEESYPSGTDDPEVPHDLSDEEETAELAEESYPSGTDDPEVPHAD